MESKAEESTCRVTVFPGNNSDLFEKDRGGIGRRGFVEICFGFQSVGPQSFRPLAALGFEIGMFRGAKTG